MHNYACYLLIKSNAVSSCERRSAWWESCTGIILYSNNSLKWLTQLWDTLRTAVTPCFRSNAKLLESLAQPNTRNGRISTGGPNRLASSSRGVCALSGCRVAQRAKFIGRLALIEMPIGAWELLGEFDSQRVG